MGLVAEMEREVERASKLLGIEVKRGVPRVIRIVKDLPGNMCSLREDETLLVSDILVGDMLPYVLAKEAAISLMVPEVDEVPQVHDLAWIYSSAPRGLWERCRVPPESPFHDYDPYRLFSLVPSRKRHEVLGTVIRIVNASARLGNLEFPMYMALLHRIVGSSVGLTESDVKLMRIITENPRATSEYMKRRGIGGSSLAKSMKKLRVLGIISGPENVDYRKLGLSTFLISFPNRRKCREAFWRFPYTCSMLVPVSGEVDAHAYLLHPLEGMSDLLSLRNLGLSAFLVKETVLRLNLDPVRDPFEAISLAASQEKGGTDELVTTSSPPVLVDKVDLVILNRVLEKGRVSASTLTKESVPDARSRLKKLREANIIVKSYRLRFPMGVEKAIVVVDSGPEEMSTLSGVLRSGGSVMVQHLDGEISRLIGVLMGPPDIRGDILRVVRTIYGERLILAEDSVDIEPGWRLPVDLWDEESQKFQWRGPLERLREDLEACLF